MWILIIVMMKISGGTIGDVQTQEFTSRDSCEQARYAVEELKRGFNTKNLRAICVKK